MDRPGLVLPPVSNLFVVRLWRRSRFLGGLTIVLTLLVLALAISVFTGLYHPTSNQAMIWAALVGFIAGLGFAARTLTEE